MNRVESARKLFLDRVEATGVAERGDEVVVDDTDRLRAVYVGLGVQREDVRDLGIEIAEMVSKSVNHEGTDPTAALLGCLEQMFVMGALSQQEPA